MHLTFLGVRGSTPSPGPAFVRYGGNTSCIAVSPASGHHPNLLLDAGTGIRGLGPMLGGAVFEGSILLSHLHWDHVQGVPFSPSVDRDGARVDMFMPAQDGRTGVELLAPMMSPPAFPITPEQLGGTWSFTAVEPGVFETDGYQVTAVEIAHKGGRTFAYLVEEGGASVLYAPDHQPNAGMTDEARAVFSGADVLIHDAQFLEPERFFADAYGHATVADAIELAESIGAWMLVLFHHGPNRTDDALDRILEGLSPSIDVIVAAEGDVLDLSGRAMLRSGT